MTSAHLASTRRRAARLLPLLGCAAMLAACNTLTTNTELTASVPDDYRLRHPIVVKEGVQTVELFIGAKRGGLNETQRAQVLAFAHKWRKEATGGILIDVPSGTSNELAAASALTEVRSILAATGVPPDAIEATPYQPNDPLKIATMRLKYPKVTAQAGPCGLWPHDLGPTYAREHYENREYYNLRLRVAAQSCRDGRQSRRPGAAARRDPALYRSPHHRARPVSPRTRPFDNLSESRPGQDRRYREMISTAMQAATAEAAEPATTAEHIAPAPRVSVQAFCETVETAAAIQAAGEDRRLGKAHLKIQMGGAAAALEAYSTAPTPNVIMIETEGRGSDILDSLDSLAEVCDAGTRVVVVGRMNDVTLYRELVRRGVSDYLIAPVGTLDVVRSICGLFSQPDAKPVGRVIAVVGAKGGVGASTIAHNIAWAIARDLSLDTVVTDLDLGFGTAGLDYNQDPPQGIADAVFSPDRVDTSFVDRLLSKCTDHLSLLAAPATLDRVYDFGAEAFDSILDSLRATVPCIVLDVPHQWAGWTKHTLVGADDILIVAGARSRQPAQRQEPARSAQVGAAERPPSALLPQPGRRTEAAGDQARRFRQGARRPAGGDHSVRAAGLRHRRQQRPDDRGTVVVDIAPPRHSASSRRSSPAAPRRRNRSPACLRQAARKR